MTPENFCYWLQGYIEIGAADKNKGSESLSIEQVACIKQHLGYVFTKPIIVKEQAPPTSSPAAGGAGQTSTPLSDFIRTGTRFEPMQYC